VAGPDTAERLALLDEPVAGDCCREHELSGYLADALEPGARARLDDHLAGCERCTGRLDRMRAEAAAFSAARPWSAVREVVEAAQDPPRRGWLSRLLGRPLWLGMPLAAAAAAALLVLLPGRGPQPPPGWETEPRVRPKGEVGLSFVVARDGRAVDGDPAEVYHPGDRLQLRYSTPLHLGLVVVGRDGTGAVSTWYDADGWSVPIRPGTRRLLDGSVVLDAAPGPELVVACFSREPVRTGEVVEAVRADRPLPEGCERASLSIRKAP